METALVSCILQAFDEICVGHSSKRDVDFDLLVRAVEGKMHDSDLQGLRHFGARVDSAVASILAPLIETGDVLWDPQSRKIAISDLGLLLLRSTRSLESFSVERAREPRAALR